MAKTNRIKLNGPAIKSRDEAELTMGRIREMTLDLLARQQAIEEEKKRIDDEHAQEIADITERKQLLTESLRAWAEANPSEFRGARSIDMVHGMLGWRTGQPTLKTIAGWTWDRVIEKLQSLKLDRFLRPKIEANKQSLLAEREQLGDAGLRDLGLKVVQDETFFADPRIETRETRTESAAAA